MDYTAIKYLGQGSFKVKKGTIYKLLFLLKTIGIACTTADPGVMNWIPALSFTFLVIDHEKISMVILLLPQIQEGLLSVTGKSMCTKYWLTALLVKLAQEKSVVR